MPYIADLGKALERKDVNVVSICAPPERRGRIAVRCAEAGKHLYLDKSLVPQLAEADALVAAVHKAGVRSHMFTLHHPAVGARGQEAARRAGRLGKLLAIHADVFFAKGQTGTAKLGSPRKEEYPPERHQLVEAKREMDNVGVYPITLIRWLTGKKFRTVYGVTANYFFQEHQKHNVEDFGLLAVHAGRRPAGDDRARAVTAGRRTRPAASTASVLVGSERTAGRSTPIGRGWRSTPTRRPGCRPTSTRPTRWASGEHAGRGPRAAEADLGAAGADGDRATPATSSTAWTPAATAR